MIEVLDSCLLSSRKEFIMGSTSTIVRVGELDVLAPLPASRRYDMFHNDRNLLESRIKDAALRMWRGLDAYEGPGKITALTPEELVDNVIYSIDSYKFTPIVPLMKKSDYQIKTKSLKLKLSGDEWEKYASRSGFSLQDKIASVHPELAGRMVKTVIQVPGVGSQAQISSGWKIVSTVESDTSGGKTKQIFELVINGKMSPTEYTSQALARAAGSKLMKDDVFVSSVVVSSRTVREDGSPLVSLRRKVTSATAEIEVSYIEVTKKNPERDGYFVLIRYRD